MGCQKAGIIFWHVRDYAKWSTSSSDVRAKSRRLDEAGTRSRRDERALEKHEKSSRATQTPLGSVSDAARPRALRRCLNSRASACQRPCSKRQRHTHARLHLL